MLTGINVRKVSIELVDGESGRNDGPARLAGEWRILRETSKAYLVRCEVGPQQGREWWVPISVVHDDSEVYSDGQNMYAGRLVVKMWWYEKMCE